MTDPTVDEISPLIFRPTQLSDIPDERTAFQRKLSVWLILLSAGFERLAFYSLTGNLVLFLTSNNIHWSSTHSVIVSFIFLGTSYVSALFFAWLSDGKLGRAKTIIIGFILYIIGYVFISLFSSRGEYGDFYSTLCRHANSSTSTSSKFFEEPCLPQILFALILTAIGVGAVQANMAVFGAEQVREQKATKQYFDKYYTAVNTGGLIAFGFIAYVQQNVSYFIGYTIPAGLLIIALIFFLIGYKLYIDVRPQDSVISNFIPILINALQTWRKHRQNAQISRTNRRSFDTPRLFNGPTENGDQLLLITNGQSWSFLDHAKISNQGRFLDHLVEDVKSLRRIIIVFLLLIPYWLIYIQIETTFLIQGVHMRVPTLFKSKDNIHYMPIIWLSLGDQLIIIVVIFFLNTFVYKRLEASGRSFSIRFRIVIGMIAAVLAMCMAGTVEIFRQDSCDRSNITQTIGKTNYTAAYMSIFYQFPQYISIGLSEVFTSVASLEFAYLAAPHSAQSLIMSLRFCSAGLSAVIGSIYVGIFITVNKNSTSKNSQCKAYPDPELFYIYFFALAGVQLVFILIFLLCDHKFQLLKTSKRRLTTRLFVGSNVRPTNT